MFSFQATSNWLDCRIGSHDLFFMGDPQMAENWALELARAHTPADGEANIFGVVAYTARHVHIREVLEDPLYWAGLDEVSGPHWVVFATVAIAGSTEKYTGNPGSLSLMRAVWKEPAANAELLSTFDLKSTESLPLLIVFVETAEGSVFSTSHPIEHDSKAAASKSLQSALYDVNQFLNRMYAENRQVETRAFDIVDNHFRNQRQWRKIKQAVSFLSWLKKKL